MLNGTEIKKILDFIKSERKKKKMDVTYGCNGFL
jgi:hypothetical protein